ncbi:DUF308 domain-containing protein [Jhaorihella thermophila]
MSEWLKWFLLGLLSVVFGVIVLGAPVVASVSVTLLTGVLLLASGVLQVIGGFTTTGAGNRLLAWLMGLLMILLGWSFLKKTPSRACWPCRPWC